MSKLDILEQELMTRKIPYERNGNQFSVALIFHEDLLKLAKMLHLTEIQ